MSQIVLNVKPRKMVRKCLHGYAVSILNVLRRGYLSKDLKEARE